LAQSLKSCCSANVNGFFSIENIKNCSKGVSDMRLQNFAGYALNTLYDSNNQMDFTKPGACKSFFVLSTTSLYIVIHFDSQRNGTCAGNIVIWMVHYTILYSVTGCFYFQCIIECLFKSKNLVSENFHCSLFVFFFHWSAYKAYWTPQTVIA